MRKICLAVLFVGIAVLGSEYAAADIYVLREGDPSNPFAATGTTAAQVSIIHLTDAGASAGPDINLPTAGGGGGSIPNAFTLAPSSTAMGHLALSTDGQYLVALGYAAPTGTLTVRNTTSTVAPRVVARVTLSGGAVDTTTALNDAAAGTYQGAASTTSDPRSVVSDGTSFWTFGNGSNVTSSGPRYVASLGATTTTQLSSSPTNVRVGRIVNGQLYESAASGTCVGVCTVGSGLPTVTGQTTTALVTTGTNSTSSSPYDFWFKDSRTLYLADDRRKDDANGSSGGGIQKWVGNVAGDYNKNGVVDAADEVLWRKGDLSADSNGDTVVDQTDYTFWQTRFGNTTPTSWSFAYVLNAGLAADGGVRGLDGYVNGSGDAVLFGTTSVNSFNTPLGQNVAFTVTDTGAGSAWTTLATSVAGNTIFRGIVHVPPPGSGSGLVSASVPEPTSMVLLVCGLATIGCRRRRA